MVYLAFFIIACIALRLSSFIIYSWKQGNKTAAAGALFLMLLAAALPVYAVLVL